MGINWYCSLEDLRSAIGQATTTSLDSQLRDAIESVSRQIDTETGHRFYAEQRVKFFQAQEASRLVPKDDLLSITSLRTDSSTNRDYGTTWATGEYDLEPVNASLDSPPSPYWEVRTSPNASHAFDPSLRRGVRIDGLWGYYQVLDGATGKFAESVALASGATSVQFTATSDFKVGQTWLFGAEQVFIKDRASATALLERAVNGTTAATHSTNSTLAIHTYPVVGQAALTQAAMDFRGPAVALGAVGAGEFGQQVSRGGGLHPFVKRQLASFRQPRAG